MLQKYKSHPLQMVNSLRSMRSSIIFNLLETDSKPSIFCLKNKGFLKNMISKPWQTFDIYDRHSTAASRHVSLSDFPKDQVEQAAIVIQDCNIGGAYIRLIVFDQHNRTFFQVFSLDKQPFSTALTNLKAGDVVTYLENKKKYIVTDRYSDEKYAKVLELQE